MNLKRFQDAKRIYNSALEREPAEREAYLGEACGSDESLREEVESLLGHRSEAQEFFKGPAVDAGAKALARGPFVDYTGRTVSHYDITEKIGEGGMGVVYKARDTHLDRFVALKVLPPEKVADPERKRRFVQEAKAASALNHPNIVTIHDIDTADGVTFIAMEFVKGRTLDRLIRSDGIVLSQTLKHAIQIADALAAAHASGIIHRDIKPANIMVTDTGMVKVLDFGLAKLRDVPDFTDAETIHATGQSTEAGIVLGTLGYMSPEQAEGKDVDVRSDIFAFGSLLYEMTTGRRAFPGETNAATVAAILREDPQPVSQVAPDTPREMQDVISRCLEKNPERRFQLMSDLKLALEELQKQSDPAALAPAAMTARRRRHMLARGAGALLVAASLIVVAWFGIYRRPARPFAKVSTFTALPGKQTEPAFSPDGKQVAFVWNGEKRGSEDNFDIYVQALGDATPRRLTNSPAYDYSPVWSPDGLHIAFLRMVPAGTEVIIIPAAGGEEKTLLVSKAICNWEAFARQYCGLAWSPSGEFMTIVDKESPSAPNTIFLLDTKTREKHKLTSPPPGSKDGLSAFSPDGSMLAFARRPSPSPLSDIYVLPLSDRGEPKGEPSRITRDNTFIYGLDWTGDGRRIVFASQRGGVPALWQVERSGGPPERLSIGGTDSLWPSVSRRGDRLAYAYGMPDVNVWRLARPADATYPLRPMRITHSPQIDMDPAFSPDGRKIAWASMHSGSHQIWVCSSDGAEPIQLTYFDTPGASTPRWSPDGRHIAFTGFSIGPTYVYLIGADGGAPRRLTTGDFREVEASWSRDGTWVYFVSNRGEGNAIWKVPAGGGSPVLVVPLRGTGPGRPAESLDGKYVYYNGDEESIWKVSVGGGSPVRMARRGRLFVEAFDGSFLYYDDPDHSIWKVPVAVGEAVRVLKIGQRALWTISAAGIHVLDPDARDGPALAWFSFEGKRSAIVRLPGEPRSYLYPLPGIAVSPDGLWTLYQRDHGTEPKIMLVENFR